MLLLLVALPFVYLVTALGRHTKELLQFVEEIRANGLPPLPENMAATPIIGEPVATFWQQLRENPRETITGHEQEVKVALHHMLTGGASILAIALQVILGIVISAFLLAGGEKVLQPLKDSLQHLFGKRDGLTLLDATGHAIRGVSIGVIGTAFIATLISWIGFAIAGIHFRLLLSALVFFFVLIQIGPLAVWLPGGSRACSKEPSSSQYFIRCSIPGWKAKGTARQRLGCRYEHVATNLLIGYPPTKQEDIPQLLTRFYK